MGERAAAAVVGGVLLVLLVVLAVRWDRPGPAATAAVASSPSTSSTASTAVARSPGSPTSAPSSTTTTTGHGGAHHGAARTTTTTPPASSPTIHPGALHRPKAGTYAIDVTSGGSKTRGTLSVTADQWQRRVVGDDRRAELLVWDRGGARLASSGEPGADGACDWDEQALAVPTDLAEGRTWSSRVTCDSTISGRAVHLERIETAAVSRRARTHVDGASVDTWVIERRVLLSIEGRGISTVTDATSTELFAPELGLPVFTASRTKVPQPDGTVRTVDASEELLHRSPSS
jgi:hypothetical protein